MSDLWTIYRYEGPTGKNYIGQTIQEMHRRAGTNGSGYEECSYFWNAIQKYGWNKFVPDIIYYAHSQQEADEWEDYFIDFYDARNPDKGYNLKAGGSNGKHSEETKKKIGKANSGRKHSEETKQKLSEMKLGDKNPMFGKHFTEISRQKLSEALSGENHPNFGKHHSQETRDKISAAGIGRHFNDFTEAELKEKSKAMSGANNPMYGIRLCGEQNPFFGKKHTQESIDKNRLAHKLSDDKEKQIITLLKQNKSKKEICDIVGCSRKPIDRIIRENKKLG